MAPSGCTGKTNVGIVKFKTFIFVIDSRFNRNTQQIILRHIELE